MRPISKFAIFLSLAGVLAILFTVFPGRHPQIKTQTVRPTEPATTRATSKQAPTEVQQQQQGGRGGGAVHSPVNSGSVRNVCVKVPAIRGVNNYGWVQLPYGTPVAYVGRTSRALLVRWDGTLLRLDPSSVALGSVVLKPSKS